MPYRTVNGMLMAYREQGVGTPLVLLHGFPLDWRIFEHQIARLSKNFRVIAPDLRGFGQTKSDQPFTITSLAEDVHALLESMGALPSILGGLSMGGYVSLAFAAKYAGDFSSLLLLDTRAESDTPEGKAARDKMIELVRSDGAKAVADQMLPKMFTPTTLQNNPSLVATLRQVMEHCPAQTIEHALIAMRDREDLMSMLGTIAAPTLIVVGEQDAITPPKMAQAMHEKIRNSQLVTIPAAGHLSTMEKPVDVSDAMLSFLQQGSA